MTKHKNKFDKLTPSEQVAIESLTKNAKKEELEDAYKEKIAKETLDKKPMSAGEVVGMIILIGIILFVLFAPIIQLSSYTSALRAAGPTICHAHGSTYINTQFKSLYDVEIICEGFTIKLP